MQQCCDGGRVGGRPGVTTEITEKSDGVRLCSGPRREDEVDGKCSKNDE